MWGIPIRTKKQLLIVLSNGQAFVEGVGRGVVSIGEGEPSKYAAETNCAWRLPCRHYGKLQQ